ncbi:hypothetical protein [Devosia sp. XK-2]|uniref:hypothetical protein n=1 Tax=Devosia sp. XK-2 TaxID=3126689 RepID=UPI0030D18DA0
MDIAGPAFWLILLIIGAIALGGTMIYGIMRNRKRTLSDKVTTELETRREYEREDHNA